MKQIRISIFIFTILSLLLGIAYPLMMTGIAQFAFPKKANGSLIIVNGRTVGSGLIGQLFTDPRYFHGRPSSNNYDGSNSGGSNFGPTNKKFIERTGKLAEKVRRENGLLLEAKIPAELVLASGSGLDPHISLDSALLQIQRISSARGIEATGIIRLVEKKSEKQYFGLFGSAFVNVLKLNAALDALDDRQ